MNTVTTYDERVLEAADELFYAHGLQAVGMDRIRDLSGVSLKRLYRCFPSKGALVEAYLRRRDSRARALLASFVASVDGADERVLAMFDWLHIWFGEPGFRGCAFTNAFGELGGDSEAVADAVRAHKEALHAYLLGLVRATDLADPGPTSEQLLVLFEGAMSVAAVRHSPEPARHARAAAKALLDAAPRRSPQDTA